MKSILASHLLCVPFMLHLAMAHNIPSSLEESRNTLISDPRIRLDAALLNVRSPETGGGSGSGGGHPGTNNNGGNRKTGNKEDEKEKQEDGQESEHEGSRDHKSEESETHAENESGKSEKPDIPDQELSPLNCSPSDSRVLARQTRSRATATACAEKSRITTTAAAARATTASPATTLLNAANGLSSANTKGNTGPTTTLLTTASGLSSANTKGSTGTGQTGTAETIRPGCTISVIVSILSIVGMYVFGMKY